VGVKTSAEAAGPAGGVTTSRSPPTNGVIVSAPWALSGSIGPSKRTAIGDRTAMPAT
jgi:hypothetical protein